MRKDGIDARIDQFAGNPTEGWPRWCVREILAARYTLLVCTEAYRSAFLGLTEFGQKRGVKWEGKVIQNILYFDEVNAGFIPIIFERADEAYIPETVKEATWIVLDGDTPAGSEYETLRARLTDGKCLPAVDLPVLPRDFRTPGDASVPNEEVWQASERIQITLDKLTEVQAKQERRSTMRHRMLIGGLLAGAFLVLIATQFTKSSVEKLVTDPVTMRAKLAKQIDQSFEEKRTTLVMARADAQRIDELFKRRDQAKARLDNAVTFITDTAATGRLEVVKQAASILQERDVDSALDYLESALRDAQRDHHETARELAEAALFKAELYEARLDFSQTRKAIEQAIGFDYTWWQPHNRLGKTLHQLAEWSRAEGEYREAERFVETDEERAVVLRGLAQLLKATNRLADAAAMIRSALAIDENRFGSAHPKVATDLSNLAQLLKITNRVTEAEPLLKRALAIDERTFGPKHPKVARDLNNLAQLLQTCKGKRGRSVHMCKRYYSARLESVSMAQRLLTVFAI